MPARPSGTAAPRSDHRRRRGAHWTPPRPLPDLELVGYRADMHVDPQPCPTTSTFLLTLASFLSPPGIAPRPPPSLELRPSSLKTGAARVSSSRRASASRRQLTPRVVPFNRPHPTPAGAPAVGAPAGRTTATFPGLTAARASLPAAGVASNRRMVAAPAVPAQPHFPPAGAPAAVVSAGRSLPCALESNPSYANFGWFCFALLFG